MKRISDMLPNGPIRGFLERTTIANKKAPTTTSQTKLQCALNAHKCTECKATSWRVVATRARKKTQDVGRSCLCLGCGAPRMFIEKDGNVSPEVTEADALRSRIAELEKENKDLHARVASEPPASQPDGEIPDPKEEGDPPAVQKRRGRPPKVKAEVAP